MTTAAVSSALAQSCRITKPTIPSPSGASDSHGENDESRSL